MRVVGLGSNLLPADSGFDGLVLRAGRRAGRRSRSTRRWCAAAAARRWPRSCAGRSDAGLSGIEFGCAIPGTVGGAVRMNAGAYGREMRERAGRGGRRLGRRHAERGAGRARPALPRLRHRAPTRSWPRAVLRLTPADPLAIRATIRGMQDLRTAAQPRKARTFGSVFKNPPGDRTSGQLLEALRPEGLHDRRRPHLAAACELHRERRHRHLGRRRGADGRGPAARARAVRRRARARGRAARRHQIPA